MTGETALQQAALAYAQHGIHIFPCWWPKDGRCGCGDAECDSPAKHPIGALAPRGVHDATCDPERVAEWWRHHPNANIAIALGANNAFALDIDGPDGQAALEALGHLPDTYQVITGRSEGSGRHHLFWQPANGTRVHNRKLAPKLETRGDGGYVIAPPSIHVSGRAYLAVGKWTQIAEPPQWLVDAATRPQAPAGSAATPQTPPGDAHARKRLQGLAAAVALAEEGNRNDTLNWAAYQAGRAVAGGQLDAAVVAAELQRAAQRAGLGEKEARKTIASGVTAGQANPDYDYAREVPVVTTIEAPDAPSAEPSAILARVQTGAEFILDTDHQIDPVWGEGSNVAWAHGEPFILTGPTGTGKTTLAHQILERLLGLTDTPLLDLPVAMRARKVLYLACDRPPQIRRAFARRFKPEHRSALTERLAVHNGYLPAMVDKRPSILLELVHAVGADVVVIDSLKDVATELEPGPAAIAINQALQAVCQGGAEVLVLHHQRKAQGDNKRPKTIDDLYGNTLIPSGAGSVLLVWGAPGDLAVELHHLKQPAGEIGPLHLTHDHGLGVTTVAEETRVDLAALAARMDGLTVATTAQALYGTSPSGKSREARNEREKARRQLDAAVANGALKRYEQGAGKAAIYRSTVPVPTVLSANFTETERDLRDPERDPVTNEVTEVTENAKPQVRRSRERSRGSRDPKAQPPPSLKRGAGAGRDPSDDPADDPVKRIRQQTADMQQRYREQNGDP